MTGPVVNGTPTSVISDDDVPLLTVLRDELGLVGTRFGCGQGLCGACFVTLDGAVVPACQTPLWQAGAERSPPSRGSPATAARTRSSRRSSTGRPPSAASASPGSWSGRPRCSTRSPTPTRARVAEALDRNLCRCGAHRRIVDAVLAARRAAVSDLPAHVVANPRLGTWITVAGREWSRCTSARSSWARASSPRSPRSPPTRSGCPSTRSGWSGAHRDGPDQGLTAGSLSVLQAGPALRHVGGVVRALRRARSNRWPAYVDRDRAPSTPTPTSRR